MQYNNSLYYGIMYGEALAACISEAIKAHRDYYPVAHGEYTTSEYTLESSNNSKYFYIYCPHMTLWGGDYDSVESAVARFNPAQLIKLEDRNEAACIALRDLYMYIVEYLKEAKLAPKVYLSWFSLVTEI